MTWNSWPLAAMALLVLTTNAHTARAQDTQTVNVAPRQLAVSLTCDNVKKVIQSASFASLSAEDRDQALIVLADCATAEHNQEHPNDPQVTIVGADPNASGDKVFFKTISRKQADQVEAACHLVGQATFAFLNAATTVTPPIKVLVGVAGAATDQGGIQCYAYMNALQNNNPMVVLQYVLGNLA
jgi:hypothetical protein